MTEKIFCCDQFERDVEGLQKRFRTLKEDIVSFINAGLKAYHILNQDNRGIFPISNLGKASPVFYKVKKFSCKSLKGRGVNSGLRIIYAYFPTEDKFVFIEMYFKQDRPMEDRERIRRLFPSRDNPFIPANFKEISALL